MRKKFLLWLISRYRHSTASRWVILAIDIFTLVVSFAITDIFRLRLSTHIDWPSLVVKLCGFIILASICYTSIGTHRSIIRHSGMYDIYKVIISNFIAAAVLVVFNIINNNHPIIQNRFTPAYSEILMTFALQSACMVTTRLTLQYVYNTYFRPRRSSCNVLIYGAGAAGVIAHNALLQDRTHDYRIVAFLDDDKKKVDTALNGKRVLSPKVALNEQYIKKHHIEILLIAIPSIKLSTKQAIMNTGLDLGLSVKSVPHINTWINDSFSYNQIQDIKIEDLLERETIKLDNQNIIREVADKVVLVTGAAGSIGSEICRQLLHYAPRQVIMLDQAESPMYDLQFELRSNQPYCQNIDRMVFVIANVKDRNRMAEVFSQYKPQIVYHAAAYKHVPFMEENPYEAILVNVFGTRIIADLSIENNVQKFVMISTDKAVNPTNVMGASKRMAEIYIQSRSTSTTRFVTTRFGNVLGSNGSVIPLFKKQLAAGGPLTVTNRDIIRYFMTIPEACNLVLEAGAMGEGGDIFVFDMGKPVKIYDLAKKMIQLSGNSGKIDIIEVGLRPGEKLYEELLANQETNDKTHNPKIMRAHVRRYSSEEIDKSYNELWELMPTLNPMLLVGKMKQIVPEFKSNNSIYCQLDQQDTNTPAAQQQN